MSGTQQETGHPVADSLSLFSQATVGADGSITNPVFTAPLTLTFGVGGPTVLTLTQSPASSNRGLIDFAPGLAGRQTDAGKMGYEAFTSGAFDIVGAGTVSGGRSLHLWDQICVGSAPAAGMGPGTGSIIASGNLAQLQLYARDAGGSQVLYAPSGFTGAVLSLFDGNGQGDYLFLNARAGQVATFDLWGELSAGAAGQASTGRGRIGLCGQTNAAAYIGGGGIYNNAGGWQRENTNGQAMFYSAGSAAQIYNICAGGGGALNLVCTFPGCGSFAVDANGSVHALAFPGSSDGRFKKDVRTIAGAEALELIAALRPVRFKWNKRIRDMGRVNPVEAKRTKMGFVGQELEQVLPELVQTWTHPPSEAHPGDDGDGDPFRGIEYDRLTPVLAAAVQELAARVDKLEAA